MDFMTQTTIPLNIIYPYTFSEGEIPQGTHSDVDFDDGQLITRKLKASSSWGANDAKAGSSSAHPLVMKSKLTVNLEEANEVWRLPIEEVREIMLLNNASV